MNPQLLCPSKKSPALCEDDNLYDDFNIDEMDLELENYKELFGVDLSHTDEFLEKGGIDSLFETIDMYASAGDLNCQGAVAAEVLKSHHPLSAIRLVYFLLLKHHLLHYISHV